MFCFISAASSVNQKLENAWLQYKVNSNVAKKYKFCSIQICYKLFILKAKYHLKYNSIKDEAFRKDLFAKTDAIIEKHNSDPKAPFHLGHSQFSIMVNY